MRVLLSTATLPSDDERERDAEQRQRLDQTDADEHGGANLVRVLRLTRHGLDGLADQDAEADPRADRGESDHETLADRLQARRDIRGLCDEMEHRCLPFLSARPP